MTSPYSGGPEHLAPSSAGIFSVMMGYFAASSALMATHPWYSSGTSASRKIASTGHSGTQASQSMHESGLIKRRSGSSWNASTGQTAAQSVYLQSTHNS